MGNQPKNEQRHWIGFRVTDEEWNELEEAAEAYGSTKASFLRLKVFGKIKGLRIIRRPHTDVQNLLGLYTELRNISFKITEISKHLTQTQRDVFGLDSALHQLRQWGNRLEDRLTRSNPR